MLGLLRLRSSPALMTQAFKVLISWNQGKEPQATSLTPLWRLIGTLCLSGLPAAPVVWLLFWAGLNSESQIKVLFLSSEWLAAQLLLATTFPCHLSSGRSVLDLQMCPEH